MPNAVIARPERQLQRQWMRRKKKVIARQAEIDALACAVLREPVKERRQSLLTRLRNLLAETAGSVLVEDAIIYTLYFAIFAVSFHHANPWHFMRLVWLHVVHVVQTNSCGACPI